MYSKNEFTSSHYTFFPWHEIEYRSNIGAKHHLYFFFYNISKIFNSNKLREARYKSCIKYNNYY